MQPSIAAISASPVKRAPPKPATRHTSQRTSEPGSSAIQSRNTRPSSASHHMTSRTTAVGHSMTRMHAARSAVGYATTQMNAVDHSAAHTVTVGRSGAGSAVVASVNGNGPEREAHTCASYLRIEPGSQRRGSAQRTAGSPVIHGCLLICLSR